ncbi:hypothetical protein BH18ACT1_BH18ACT1_06730 [soil metagenome]
MISLPFVSPVAVALFAGLTAGLMQRHLRPALATRVLTTLTAVAAAATVAPVALFAAVFIVQLPPVTARPVGA